MQDNRSVAADLVGKFFELIPIEYKGDKILLAKQAALISINETIDFAESNKLKLLDDFHWKNYPKIKLLLIKEQIEKI